MILGYKFYRNNLITMAILSIACIGMFWDYFTGRGHPDTEPGALILIAAIIIVGNGWLFIAMRRAKRREQAVVSPEAPDVSARVLQKKPEPTPEEAIRKRKNMRRFMSGWCVAGGLLFVIFGREWLVNGLPVPWVGFALILLGILGFAGVNVFYGGPLDLRLDRPQPPQHQATDTK
jgi:hypothetical protein